MGAVSSQQPTKLSKKNTFKKKYTADQNEAFRSYEIQTTSCDNIGSLISGI